MKIGKVSQTVLKRSMLKPLKYKREEAIVEVSPEEMCYGVQTQDDEQCISTCASLYGDQKDLGVFALAQVVNDLATRGAKAVGAGIYIMLPPYAYESRLKSMMEYVEEAAKDHAVQIMCAKAEVFPAIAQAIVTVHGIGVVKEGTLVQSNMGRADQDIVLLKWIGLEGTLRVMKEKEEELSKRFVPTFLNKIKDLQPQLFSEKELGMAKEYGVSAMHQITSGGILAALWEIAESSNVGIEVDLKQMTIKQETVEICEYFHLNPYQLTSVGSIIIFADQGEALVEKFREEGICASLLGRTTQDTVRVILGGEERRFLDRPAADELLKIY